MIRSDAVDLIGNTALVALKKLSPPGSLILAKAEFQNPGGSIKDRAARHIIETAFQTGLLQRGQTVVEMTSGNMGSGLAVVCAAYGNPLLVVMSRGNSPERVRMLEALGAQVVLVDQAVARPGYVTGEDITRAVAEAKRQVVLTHGYYVDQFNNEGSVQAHERTTGPEILRDTDGDIQAFVACVGSAGTLIGTSRFLKSRVAAISCIAVEPLGSQVLAGRAVDKAQHLIQGTGYGSVPPHWDAGLIDHCVAVSDEEVLRYKKLLAHEEGLHVGYSSAANVCACVKAVESGLLPTPSRVVTVLCDTGLKYS